MGEMNYGSAYSLGKKIMVCHRIEREKEVLFRGTLFLSGAIIFSNFEMTISSTYL